MGFLNYLDTMALDTGAVHGRCEMINEDGVQCASAGYSVANATAPDIPGGATTRAIDTAAERLHAALTGFGRQLSNMGRTISVYADNVSTADTDGSDAFAGASR
ncbi:MULTISPECIES: hypothetical protein [Corynebacterium]|jgi:hypothetical protein|uniref:Uncharacterized protein n=2 Tax=Corynebacterium jeikeium TaxID=38289 RepID=Q4JXW5_CORJK|nr:hypothetical protein [Corynebacterium jeikeium]EEW16587.1 hypothetical protein HMPREF0297_1027 [Corynebacterium jeikeium ATCC 43734]OOD29833.1 hypothetical protein BWP03_08475 [Corynebacterium jeikeium]CAI36342.1 hypothetical protein jk0190 [Corynebacterium jeikeium K411]